MKSLSSDDSLSIKDLTLKLTVLLALAAASRASEISYLDITFMGRRPSCYVFSFPKLTKICRPGKSSQDLKFPTLEEGLCVCHTLDTYLERLKPLRSEENTQSLLSYIKSHDPVKKCTVSRWMVKVLNPIPTGLFGAELHNRGRHMIPLVTIGKCF